MRELLSICCGNEMTVGMALFAWLFWVGFGSWVAGRFWIQNIEKGNFLLSILQLIFAFSLPATCIFIRAIPYLLNLSGGQVLNPLLIFALSLISLSVVCVLVGFLFILAFHMFSFQVTDKKTCVGKAYILEAAGAAAGGMAISLVLTQNFRHLEILFLLSIINISLAFLVSLRHKLQAIGNLAALIIIIFVLWFKIPVLRDYSFSLRWPRQNLVYSTDTIYSNIAVTDYEGIKSFYINGLLSFSSHNELAAENIGHFPMLEHPAPKKILLIGGGIEALSEILKYDLTRLDCVEIDPEIIKLALKFCCQEEILKEKKLKLITNTDGRLFVKMAGDKYDLIILNLPPPQTTLINRFYTVEFFQEAKSILSDDGILAFSLTSCPDYISQEQRNFYSCLKASLEKVFEEVLITPGFDNFFFACKKKGILTDDWQKLVSRLAERKIETVYFREYYLFAEFSRQRMENFRNLLQMQIKMPLNLDFKPIGYFYNIILHSSVFKYSLSFFFKKINSFGILLFFLFISACLILVRFIRKVGVRNLGILTCIATLGFSQMLFQIIILFAFQAIYGYMYYKLGVIFAFFMVGIITGSYLANSLLVRRIGNMKIFIKMQTVACLYPIFLVLLLLIFKNNRSPLFSFIGSNLIFPLLPLIAGFIGGFQFPLANELYLKENRTVTTIMATTYGVDLWGASTAAILGAVVLVPMFGIVETCALSSVLNTAGLLIIGGEK